MKKITFLFLISLMISCQSIAKKVNGEKKPKKESIESLSNFLNANDLDLQVENSLFLKDPTTLELLSQLSKSYLISKNKTSPYIFLFNDKHLLVDDDVLGGCIIDRPNTTDNFYTALLQRNEVIDEKFSLNRLSDSFLDFNGKKITQPYRENQPVLLVVWAKFRGNKINRAFLNETQRTLINKSPDLQIIYLNIDQVFF
jgi:hypothetical protein